MLRTRWKILTALLALALIAGGLIWFAFFSPNAEELTARAEAAMQSQDYQLAESLSRIALAQSPRNTPAAKINALAQIELNRFDSATQRVEAFLAGNPDAEDRREFFAAVSQAYFDKGRLAAAMDILATSLDSDNSTTTDGLPNRLRIEIARLSGDRAMLQAMLEEPLDSADTSRLFLANLFPSPQPADRELLERGVASSPADPLALTGLALLAEKAGDVATAAKMCKAILKLRPGATMPLAIQANTSANTSDDSQWRMFVLRLPTSALNAPAMWHAFGRRCEVDEQRPEAIRCYYEAVKQGANHANTFDALARLLADTNEPELADAAKNAGVSFDEVQRLGQTLLSPDSDPAAEATNPAQQEFTLANKLETLGRDQEAAAWRRLIKRKTAKEIPAEEVEPLLTTLSPLGNYPIPDWLARRQEQRRRTSETSVEPVEQ